MDMNTFMNEFGWFLALGYVVVVATILSMLLINLFKVTILKNKLATCDSTQKDKLLGNVGTVTSLVVYAIVYIANEMILQMTFFIDLTHVNWVQIPSGAAVTWVAAKGWYTVLHKFIQRIKDGKLTAEEVVETKADVNTVKNQVAAQQSKSAVLTNAIGSTAKAKAKAANVDANKAKVEENKATNGRTTTNTIKRKTL